MPKPVMMSVYSSSIPTPCTDVSWAWRGIPEPRQALPSSPGIHKMKQSKSKLTPNTSAFYAGRRTHTGSAPDLAAGEEELGALPELGREHFRY